MKTVLSRNGVTITYYNGMVKIKVDQDGHGIQGGEIEMSIYDVGDLNTLMWGLVGIINAEELEDD